MGAASSIQGPKTPMQLVASLKKFVAATEINFDDAFCNREDIDALIGREVERGSSKARLRCGWRRRLVRGGEGRGGRGESGRDVGGVR